MFASAAAAASLCGNWDKTSLGKCSQDNQCCIPANTDPIPSCPANPQPDSSSIITDETYQFAGDGAYSITVKVGTGNSCPLGTGGTLLFQVVTEGSYFREGDNSNIGNGWERVRYTPNRFITTILKSNQASPFTAGTQVGTKLLGPCAKMEVYLNDAKLGCPCNQTWAADSIAKVIDPSKCPTINGSSTCPEAYFFSNASRYGSIRLSNQTNGQNVTRLLEITQPYQNQSQGWNTSVVYANFTADFSCPSTINITGSLAPSAYSAADILSVTSVPYLFVVWIFAFVR